MSIKPPRVEAIELGNLDFKKYTVFALPVSFIKDKTFIQNQLFKNAIEKNFNLDLKEYLNKDDWEKAEEFNWETLRSKWMQNIQTNF